MDTPPPAPDDGVIRLSRDEALSEHVDDLLKRQMSLRGEAGITRDRRRHWYYQNWFVFLVAGLLAAVGAWALVEPFYDDMFYVQGKIGAVDPDEVLGPLVPLGDQSLALRTKGHGCFDLGGRRFWLAEDTCWLKGERKGKRVAPKEVKTGQTLGIYVEYFEHEDQYLALARFLVPDPPPAARQLPLPQLKAQHEAISWLIFAVVAGFCGLAIGAADGAVCRLTRRALLCGGVGLLVGFVGGFISNVVANLAYAPLSQLASRNWDASKDALSTFGFVVQMVGRSLAWCLAGMAMGLGQGIALRSKRLLLYGFLGGTLGGLLGGLLFDPIDLLLLGTHKPSAHWSRLVGFMAVCGGVGAMVGVVELLARDVWLRMVEGPLAGKEFLLFKDTMHVGSSPRSEIYLFNDPQVAPHHATLRALGDDCEVEAADRTAALLVNNRPAQRARLRHGDRITLGRTSFIFQKRKG
jgi:hypothetical protein